MNFITLNKAQEKQLLLLCKKFFPEFNEFRIGSISGKGDKQKTEFYHYFIWMEKGFKYEHDDDIERDETYVIGWYQLCLTELSKKIWNSTKQSKVNINYQTKQFQQDVLNSKHPVDFLYNFYKKNK